jgi:hypothetical protein
MAPRRRSGSAQAPGMSAWRRPAAAATRRRLYRSASSHAGSYDLVTVYSRENNTTADGQQRIRIGDSARAISQDGDINNNAMRTRLRTRLESRLSQSRAAGDRVRRSARPT